MSAVAIPGKFGGCAYAAWASGVRPKVAACIGVMMNTRGLMELVVVNAGKDLGVTPDSVFCMLVLMAQVTTVMTTPLVPALRRGTEIEEPTRRSGFTGNAPEAEAVGRRRARLRRPGGGRRVATSILTLAL